MAENVTLARPYARAIFELAQTGQDGGDFRSWSGALNIAAQVAADGSLQKLIDSPSVERGKIADVVIDVCGENLPEQGKNLVRLLAENNRLGVLPGIAAQYEILRAEAESVVDAEMISAREVTAEQQSNVTSALERRMGRKVNLKISIDDSLLGGAIIKAGDLVIDGSAKGQLEKLSYALAS